MLILSRKNQQSVVVGSASSLERLVTVTVLDIRGGKVKLGFDVALDLPVHRQEVWDRIQAEGEQQGPTTRPFAPEPH